ncbi:UNVERIFIED_CONTAM: hypothetical protein Sradi_6870400 [Sesamum radiatum]|uniref:Integrase zinc-binding domain-containing protein n=1 Tax=Sesamum radiatum TaxID=300843 RepID=A0AAW2JKR2_SESRA
MGSWQAQDTSHSFHNAGTYPYKKSYTHPLLRCLSTEEGIRILQKIHSGCCRAHTGTRIMANKALWARYFWPTMKQDAIRLVSKCERCQKHSSLIQQPEEPLTTMLSPCPFIQRGMDIVGLSSGHGSEEVPPARVLWRIIKSQGPPPCSYPLEDHQITGATPYLGPLKDRQLTGVSPLLISPEGSLISRGHPSTQVQTFLFIIIHAYINPKTKE